MNAWSTSSQTRYDTLDPLLQLIATHVAKRFNCSILCGHRDRPEQDEAFRTGKSKATFPNSKHNVLPSRAMDIAPYFPNEDTYNNLNCMMFSCYVQAVADMLGIPVRIGNGLDPGQHNCRTTFDWDATHCELI